MKKIERVNYLEKLKGLCLIPDIKIITGVRRSGKCRFQSIQGMRTQQSSSVCPPQADFYLPRFLHTSSIARHAMTLSYPEKSRHI